MRLRFRSSLVRGLVLLMAAVVALAAWALSSPLGASPDDDFHLNSAWCGLGERDGLCEATEEDRIKRVPVETHNSAFCFAFKPEQSAECQELGNAGEALDLIPTERGNFVNQYPPLYYAFTGMFASQDVVLSALAMRLTNALIFLGLVTAVSIALPSSIRRAVIWPAVLALVPLGMFLVASNNPSSWAITSALTAWAAYYGYLLSSGRRKFLLALLTVIAAAVGAGARSDSAAYTVLAMLLASLLVAQWSRRFLLKSLLGVGVLALVIVLNLGSRSAGVATSGFGGSSDVNIDGFALVASNALNMPFLWTGVFGTWGLGWLDTSMPAIVWFATLSAFVSIIFWALRGTTPRQKVAIAVIALALWAIPSYVLLLSKAQIGAEVQPRYILPLVIIIAGFALVRHPEAAPHALTGAQTLVVGLAIAGANLVALHVNMRRYVTGTDGQGINLDVGAEWWWEGLPFGPTAVWLVGSAAFAVAVLFALSFIRNDASRALVAIVPSTANG